MKIRRVGQRAQLLTVVDIMEESFALIFVYLSTPKTEAVCSFSVSKYPLGYTVSQLRGGINV